MNGLDAARALKMLIPNVPLLLFTNNDGGMVESEARCVGISPVISKSESDALGQLLDHAKHFLDQTGGWPPTSLLTTELSRKDQDQKSTRSRDALIEKAFRGQEIPATIHNDLKDASGSLAGGSTQVFF